MRGKRSVLVIGDPWPELEVERDSSLHLLREGIKAFRIDAFWATPGDVFARDDELLAVTTPVRFSEKGPIPFFELKAHRRMRGLLGFDHVLWRCDPPLTLETYRLWALFVAVPGLRIWNSPGAMLNWNEKFAPLRYPRWAIPVSLVNSEEILRSELKRLGKEKRLILKPCAAAASYGVRILSNAPSAAASQLRELVRRYGGPAVIQEVDERIHTHGELRFFAIGGRVVSAVQKFPGTSDPIMNWYARKSAQPRLQMADPATEGYATALFRARRIARDLWREGVHLASIDFIADRILEINVTSPGLLKWVDEIGRFTLEKPPRRTLAEMFWESLIG